MRIGIMCHSSFGGSARIATELAAALARWNHRVHLFTRATPFGNWDHQASGVLLHRIVLNNKDDGHLASLYPDWPSGEFEALLSGLLHVIVTEGLDVLHFHYAAPFAFAAAEVSRRLGQVGPLLIGTLHGTDVSIYGRDPVKGPQLAQALRHVCALTTVSVSHARLSAEVFGLPTRPQVIPNFVDLSRFRPPSHAAWEPNARSRPKIVHVSNFRPVKDPQSMARIFLGIRKQMDAELWLIGDGQEMDAVKSIFQQSEFEHDVRYWGLRRDVAPLLAQGDLLLMTSLYESFCLAALEAMACGVPVLATKVGGLPEVVVDGKTGFLFPVGDLDSAVRLAVGLLSDPDLHRAMREAAARHARQFGHKAIVPVYEDLYQRLLHRRSGMDAAIGRRRNEAADCVDADDAPGGLT